MNLVQELGPASSSSGQPQCLRGQRSAWPRAQEFLAEAPRQARSFYYRDDIGNISTSVLRHVPTAVRVCLSTKALAVQRCVNSGNTPSECSSARGPSDAIMPSCRCRDTFRPAYTTSAMRVKLAWRAGCRR